MALPHWLTRANLVVFNRLTAPFAAWLPGFAIVEHVGRRSGQVRRNPISLLRRDDTYLVALYYGPEVEWLANVRAAGRCRMRRRGRWITLVEPRLFRDPKRRAMPFYLRPFQALMGVDWFVSSAGFVAVPRAICN